MQRTQTGPDKIVETQPSTTTDYDDNGKGVIVKSSQRTQLTPANQIIEGRDDTTPRILLGDITISIPPKEHTCRPR
jgi:hypothetical protein